MRFFDHPVAIAVLFYSIQALVTGLREQNLTPGNLLLNFSVASVWPVYVIAAVCHFLRLVWDSYLMRLVRAYSRNSPARPFLATRADFGIGSPVLPRFAPVQVRPPDDPANLTPISPASGPGDRFQAHELASRRPQGNVN